MIAAEVAGKCDVIDSVFRPKPLHLICQGGEETGDMVSIVAMVTIMSLMDTMTLFVH